VVLFRRPDELPKERRICLEGLEVVDVVAHLEEEPSGFSFLGRFFELDRTRGFIVLV
jgi:hypothetical protein